MFECFSKILNSGAVLVVFALLLPSATMAGNLQISRQSMLPLAKELYENIHFPADLAVVPINAKGTEIPQHIADEIVDAFISALIMVKPDNINLKDRSSLRKVWEEAREFNDSSFSRFMNEAGADLAVIGTLHTLPAGIRIKFIATKVRSAKDAPEIPGDRATVLASTDFHTIPFDFSTINSYRPERAVIRAVNTLLPVMRSLAGAARIKPYAPSSGTGNFEMITPYAQYLAEMFAESANGALDNSKGSGIYNPVEGANSAASTNTGLRVKVVLRDHGDIVPATFHLMKDDVLVSSQTLRIKASAIPENYKPIVTYSTRKAGSRIQTVATAIPNGNLTQEEAIQGAKALARARAILRANKLDTGVLPDIIRSPDDAAGLLKLFSKGIPYEERWRIETTVHGHVKIYLTCRVKTIYPPQVPSISGRLRPKIIVSGEPVVLRLDARRTSYIGVFAWQADGSVVRLYPYEIASPIKLSHGDFIRIPNAMDPYQKILAATMPGAAANHEALVVLSSDQFINFSSLAPLAGASVDESLKASTSSEAFLERLSRVNSKQVEITAFPYQVVSRNSALAARKANEAK